MKVSKKEWELANEFFSSPKNKDSIKLSRKKGKDAASTTFLKEHNTDELDHSFVRVNGIIYAVDTNLLGEGAFGKVKTVQDESGNEFAIKIEGIVKGVSNVPPTEEQYHDELQRLSDLGLLKGQEIRKVDPERKDPVMFKGKSVIGKQYTVQKKIEGVDLSDWFDNTDESTYPSYSERLFYGLKICEAYQELHKKNILHVDVKPQNIKITKTGAELLDFGLSLKLEADEAVKTIPDRVFGTPPYIAPEVGEFALDDDGEIAVNENGLPYLESMKGNYSKASERYAITVMLLEDLYLGYSDLVEGTEVPEFYATPVAAMNAPDPATRPSLEDTIKYLKHALIAQPDYEDKYKSLVEAAPDSNNKENNEPNDQNNVFTQKMEEIDKLLQEILSQGQELSKKQAYSKLLFTEPQGDSKHKVFENIAKQLEELKRQYKEDKITSIAYGQELSKIIKYALSVQPNKKDDKHQGVKRLRSMSQELDAHIRRCSKSKKQSKLR